MNELSPETISLAAQRLAGVVNRTPVMTSRTLDDVSGCRVFVKCENFQRVGAFKFRGAYNAISRLSDRQRDLGVITHSSGNHAQGVALASHLCGARAVVVMPQDAPQIKREATAAYGAQIIPCKAEERESVTQDLIEKHGYHLIHPYDNDQIIAGQGTAAWELLEDVNTLDVLLVPVGGGGLISGSALAVAARAPGCRVIGVEPRSASDAGRSWRENRIVTLPVAPATIADGLRTRYIGQRNLRIMRRYVQDMITVTEEEIIHALRFAVQRMKIVIEPSAAVALAPLLSGRLADAGGRAGVILSGGNTDIIHLRLPQIE